MPFKPIDTFPAGGVDSRSNPINMPPNRYLEVLNFWPREDGSFQLRDGYSQFVAGLQGNVPIYSICPVVGPGPDYKDLIVFWQNKVPYVLDPATNVITSPTIKGTAIASPTRWSYFYTDGHLHAFNGTDAKWFDGVYWRDIGLPQLSGVSSVAIAQGIAGITPTQAAAVTLTFSSGGAWPGNDVTGEFVYLSVFDTATNNLSPLVQIGSGYPVLGITGDKLTLGTLPTFSIATYLLLCSITTDGGAVPSFLAANGSGGAPTALPGPSSMTSSGSTVTVDSTGHGLSSGEVIYVNVTTGTPFSAGPFAVTVTGANSFTFQSPNAASFNGQTATIYQLLTTGIIQNYQYAISTLSPYLTADNGIAASTIGGTQPGYQFYGCLYNPTTGHVGNRASLGPRIANTGPCSPTISGLPTPSDSEWVTLLGRTGDGAEVPYVIIDANGNWVTVPNGTSSFTVSFANIDGTSELPTRNYPPPGTLDYNTQLAALPGGATENPPITGTFTRAWVESDHCCGTLSGSPTVYRSGSLLDMVQGVFVGLSEQSWDPADIETFPTGEAVTCGQGYQGESWIYSKNDCAALMELAGQTQWQGPWNIGCCGQYAWARGWQNMPFWVTQEKELATISSGGYMQIAGMMSQAASGPIVISNEYEASLLAKIGSAYISETEVVYIRLPLKGLEVLRIKARDVSGNPFTIIHDFRLRDERSPFGQAYEEDLLGPLASDFTQSYVRDGNGASQVFAGATNGTLYELYSGSNDAGSEFTAQAIALPYIGPDRTSVNYLEWYGDSTVKWFISSKLNLTQSEMIVISDGPPDTVVREDGNSHWVVTVQNDTGPEMIHAFILMQLQSHSVDGSTALNTPPHFPLESYGRVWLISPLAGETRGK